MDDSEIIQKVLEGDPAAYAELVRRHHVRVLELCMGILSDRHAAEDAAQEIFMKALEHLSRFKGGSSFYTWLYRITTNHCLDLLRKRRRRSEESWEKLLETRGPEIEKLFAAPSPQNPGPDQELVGEVLAHLSPEERLVLVLREMEGLSYEEMAETFRCSLDAVKGRLKRARRNFEEKVRHFLRPGNV